MLAGTALARRARSPGAFSAWLLLVLCGCTEPQFAPDDAGDKPEAGTSERSQDAAAEAATPDANTCEGADCASAALPGLDAGEAGAGITAPGLLEAGEPTTPSDAGLDPVRKQWAGRYATRSFVFSYDDPVRPSARHLTIVDIAPSADGGLTLTEELCRFESAFTFVATANVLVDFPPGIRSSSPLSYDAGQFNSQLASAHVGYGPVPDDCAPGRTSSAGESRPWLSNGTCDCPSGSGTPTSVRDCRVVDSDGDSQPGNTFPFALDTSLGVFRVAQEQRHRLVNGYRSGDRLYAQREYSDVTKVLSCTIENRPARVEDCPLGTVGPCPAMFNQVEMRLIEPSEGCAELREREIGWFVKPKPEYPGACPALVVP